MPVRYLVRQPGPRPVAAGSFDGRTWADRLSNMRSSLDLVISTDTSVSQLAGALAKRVWAILPFVAGWRWLPDFDESPWYPTARSFRQDDSRAWEG
jgi:hypothetical protein